MIPLCSSPEAPSCGACSYDGSTAKAVQTSCSGPTGRGLSERSDYRGNSFRELGVSYIAGVLDALKIDKAAVIGNSIGGFWSLAFALAKPERLTKLILIGEVAGSTPDQGKARVAPSKPVTAEPVKTHHPSLERTRAKLASRRGRRHRPRFSSSH